MTLVDIVFCILVFLVLSFSSLCYVSYKAEGIAQQVFEETTGTPTGFIVNTLILFMTTSKFPLSTLPICEAVAELFQTNKIEFHIIIRLGVLVFILITSFMCPYFVTVVGLAGWIISPFMIVVLPCMCYLKLAQGVSRIQSMVLTSLAAFSVLLSLAGTCRQLGLQYYFFNLEDN